MGRQLHRVNSGDPFEDYHPGCLWSLLHILYHHHGNNVRKIAPHKKHNRRRPAKCCGNPKTISIDRDNFTEARGLLDAEADNFQIEPLNKNIMALVNEEMSKEENNNNWVAGLSAERKFQRTNSLHHLEPSDYHVGEISADWANPIIILQKNANTSAGELHFSSLKKTNRRLVSTNKDCDVCHSVNVEGSIGQYQNSGKFARVQSDKTMGTTKNQAKLLERDNFHHQVKEYMDVLEIFKVNKDLFLDILQNPHIAASKQFPGLQISNRKAKLTKSGSFPVADMSQGRYLRPSTLEHKQKETWNFQNGEKLVSTTQVPKLDTVRSQEGYYEKMRPSLAEEDVDSAIEHEASTFPRGPSSRDSNHRSWNQLVLSHLRDIKQRIKHAIKESRKERVKANNEVYLQRDLSPPSTDEKVEPKSSEAITRNEGGLISFINRHDTDVSDHDISNSEQRRMRNSDHYINEPRCMRRTASLNESLDRYARLFDSSLSREAKLPHSKSLRLTNELNIPSRDRAPKFFRRISSLSDVESFYSLVNVVIEDSEKAVSTEVDHNINSGSYARTETKSSSFAIGTDQSQPLDAAVGTEFHKNTDEGRSGGEGLDRTSEPADNIIEPAKFISLPLEGQEIEMAMNPIVGLAQSTLDSEPEIISPAQYPISEASESNPPFVPINEADSSNVKQNVIGENSLPSLCGKMNHENDTHFQHFHLDIDEASFNYVKDILQLSGFTGNESLGKWYSLEQLLDPSLFKEMEAYLHHQVNHTEVSSGNCDHQLLFDLINEVLIEIYETSFTYFPRDFSFNHRIRPMPKGHRVLSEVWSRICWFLSFRSELDRSLDDIVAKDLAKGDGWMNHQFDTECVALELEDLIFDELLEEVIC